MEKRQFDKARDLYLKSAEAGILSLKEFKLKFKNNFKEFEFAYTADRVELDQFLSDLNDNSTGVYCIFSEELELIKSRLGTYRNQGTKFRFPPVGKTRKAIDNCVYVGMVSNSKHSIKDRLMQHLFMPATPGTSALRMSQWIGNKSPVVRIKCFLTGGNTLLTEHLEATLWNYYEPAIGRLKAF